MSMNLSGLKKETHAIAKDSGWWDPERTLGDHLAMVHYALSAAMEEYAFEAYSAAKEQARLEGVAAGLADVVTSVTAIAEHYGYDVNPDSPGLTPSGLDYYLTGLESFGDWISRLHWFGACAFDHWHGQASDDGVSEALASLVVGVQRMADHYGIDLDAAIAENMENMRSAAR